MSDKKFSYSDSLRHHYKIIHKGIQQIRKLECGLCTKTFISPSQLKTHKEIHENIKRYTCDICQHKTSVKSSLNKHKRIRHGGGKYRCNKCTIYFETRTDHLKHMTDIHKVSPQLKSTCEFCGQKYLKIKEHIEMVHKGIRNYKCDICNKRFVEATALKRHLLHIHEKTRYQCELCEKTFCDKTTVANHRKRAHDINTKKVDENSRKNVLKKKETSKKTHQCSFCAKHFSTADSAKDHEKIVHKHIRNYKCDHCQKSFGRNPELTRHIEEIHEKVKYKCDVCSKTISSKSYLIHHKRMHLSNGQRFECKECEKEYKDAGGLRRHVKSIHLNVRYNCDPCKKVLFSEGGLRNHKKSASHLNKIKNLTSLTS